MGSLPLLITVHGLEHALTVGGYSTKLVGLIYGSLGHVHRLCVRELQIAELNNKKNSK